MVAQSVDTNVNFGGVQIPSVENAEGFVICVSSGRPYERGCFKLPPIWSRGRVCIIEYTVDTVLMGLKVMSKTDVVGNLWSVGEEGNLSDVVVMIGVAWVDIGKMVWQVSC
jgi:hypothetical protein